MAVYPAAIDLYTPVQGTTLLAPVHAAMHNQVGTAVVAIENVLGTTLATNLFTTFQNGDVPLRDLGGGGTLAVTLVAGTLNFFILGTPKITGGTLSGQLINNGTIAGGVHGTALYIGGTANNQIIGTPAITGGTTTSQLINNATIGSTSVLVPLQSAFWAQPGTTNQVFGTVQTTQVTWGSLKYDLLSEFGTATNSFIAKQAGLYQFTTFVPVNGVTAGQNISIRLNGTTQQGNFQAGIISGGWVIWQGSVPIGGTVDVADFNNDGANPGTMGNTSIASFYGKRVF